MPKLRSKSRVKGRWSEQLDTRTHLICDVDVHVLTEGIALREPCGTILNQVEGLERPKGRQQLFYLQEPENSSEFHQAKKGS